MKSLYIVGRGVLTCPSFSDFVQPSPPLPTLLSTPTSTPTVLSVVLFISLNGWSCHIWCAILPNDNMDLLSSLGTLVPEGPWCVFYATRHQVYWSLIYVFFTGTMIWYHTFTNTQAHTAHSGTSRLTHPYKYIYTTCYVLTVATFITLND